MINLNAGKLWQISILAAIMWFGEVERSSLSQTIAAPIANNCDRDLETLTASLLKDLPNYANRVIQRTKNLNREVIDNYIISTGRANFVPLNLPNLQYDPIDSQSPEQVFFTVLERQYSDRQVREIQTYHWLFLTPTDSGWRMVMMFSRFGNKSELRPPTPPRETSNGILGQGVQLWLRDCRAGKIM